MNLINKLNIKMENELTECPKQEKIKPGIQNGNKEAETSKSGKQLVTSSKNTQDFKEKALKLDPNSSTRVPTKGIFTETSEECSQTPLKKRRYESPTEITNNNGCAVPSLPATNKEIIKNEFKCRFCSFIASTEVAFTMHLLQHITGQSKAKDQQQDKNIINSDNNSSSSSNSESLKNSISITITAPKNHSVDAKDIKRSIVDEILKKLGFGGGESEAEQNTNNKTRNKEANVKLGNLTENKNGNINIETNKNNGEKKAGPLLKTYARKSPNKPSVTKPPPYNSPIVESNIDNEAITDSNQLLIDPAITEELNMEWDSSYHILKDVIHAEIHKSDETHYQFVPNNVKQFSDVKNAYSLFTIETAHDSILTPRVEPTPRPAKNSVANLPNVSIITPEENDSIFKESGFGQQPDDDDDADDNQTYRCFDNKVTIPSNANFGLGYDFQCQFCPTKTAPAEKHFRHHYRMHFTKKGIQCPFCTYRSTKSNVIKHLFCHTPKETFMCPMCRVMRSNKESLTDHLKLSHSRQLFEKHDLVCRSWYCGK